MKDFCTRIGDPDKRARTRALDALPPRHSGPAKGRSGRIELWRAGALGHDRGGNQRVIAIAAWQENSPNL